MSFNKTGLKLGPFFNLNSAGVGDNSDFIRAMAEDNGEAKLNQISMDDDSVKKTDAELIKYGLDLKVASKLDEMYRSGKLSHSDLDERALDGLKEFSVEGAVNLLTQLSDSNLEYVSNKSAYLCSIMTTYRQKSSMGNTTPAFTPAKGPDDDKIKAILERTGYSLDVTTGQRKYGGPPPNWDGPPPGPGCEILVKMPKDVFEDELIMLFEKIGKIWDLRIMMDPMTGTNRGYALVRYTTKDEAQQATKDVHNYEIKPGMYLKVTASKPNQRLYVGNISQSKGKQEIMNEFAKLTDGLTDVIHCRTKDKMKNRGFCFLEYESHRAAFLAKQRLETEQVKLWGCDIIVDWAEPREEPDSETMAAVKVLFVRNFTKEFSMEKLKEAFEVFGKVDKVQRIKDYALIHFDERDHAVNAMNDLNGKNVGGSCIEVSLAKPPYGYKRTLDILRSKKRRRMVQKMRRLRAGRFSPPHPSIIGPFPRRGPMPRDYDHDYCYGRPAQPGGCGTVSRGRAGRPQGRGVEAPEVVSSSSNNRFQQPQLWGTQTQDAPHRGHPHNHQPACGSQRVNQSLAGKRKLDGGNQNQDQSKRRYQRSWERHNSFQRMPSGSTGGTDSSTGDQQ